MNDAENTIPRSIRSQKKKSDWPWDYVNELANEAHFQPLPGFYSKGLTFWQDFQAHNLLHFKEYDLHFLADDSIEIVKSKLA